ncbi:hypothetical protein [Kribbella albertanoniae]|uniref:Uncharacterized protein n=1 Tax=Kribbella albertanoniae TaxID=1266829 RepID=A0A4R4P911_9ACTN|nr:hypothetical protein [Kribbella albertanoniae]TDC17337.1 hypothetical protein E1261_37320 [Kribbella albertanoniae]
MSDELLRPTIGERVDPKVRPWRLNSQAYVAFFGGVIAATIIASLNARRLGLDRGKRWMIIGTGVVGLTAVIALYALLNDDGERTQSLRIVVRIVAVLCILVQMRWQRPMDRAFQLRGTDYHSMWVLGPILVVVCAIVEALLLALVVML